MEWLDENRDVIALSRHHDWNRWSCIPIQQLRLTATASSLRHLYYFIFKMPSNPKNYTDPELREEVKNEVQQGDKGGKPGQWSARKVFS